MSKLLAKGVALAIAATALVATAVPADAKHRHHHSGIALGFSFGAPGYYDYGYRPHRPYRAYRAAPRHYGGSWSAHVAWCYDRYRSYRAADNTYQPYHAPRRECRSPYFG